jgi:hypothetical protein
MEILSVGTYSTPTSGRGVPATIPEPPPAEETAREAEATRAAETEEVRTEEFRGEDNRAEYTNGEQEAAPTDRGQNINILA